MVTETATDAECLCGKCPVRRWRDTVDVAVIFAGSALGCGIMTWFFWLGMTGAR